MKSFVHGEINEFVQWYDTDGNIINASDGGIIYADGKYHWYGQSLRPLSATEGGQITTVGVVMYESENLLDWKYEGVILAPSNDPESEIFAPLRFERPKIIYNDKTKQYVLWCHYVRHPGRLGRCYGESEAGVAVCDRVNGEYKWLGWSRPVDSKGFVRDSALYKDSDGTAYFIYDRHVHEEGAKPDFSEDDRCLYVVKLSDDYLSFTDTYKRIDAAFWREAPAIVHKGEYYYIVTSGLTSWATNQAQAFRTKHLLDRWESIGDPCVDDETHTTFNTQSSFAFKVEGIDTHIMMFERHNTNNFVECSYVWLPVEFNDDNTISLRYKKEWSI